MNYSILVKNTYNIDNICYSIITPVYNQEDVIVKNISSYIKNTDDNFEIIIILDSCSDNTKENLLQFIRTFQNYKKQFIQIQIIETMEPLFETKCDNIGFNLAQGKYLLEIQADMEMTQFGYNKHLTKPFNILPNVIAVSGRCAHNLFRPGGIGKLGRYIETNIDDLKIDRNIYTIVI
jgi:glycosyltransferase involved in cell wall biosynthesis